MPDKFSNPPAAVSAVKRCYELDSQFLRTFFAAWGLHVMPVADGNAIPGSHWGDDEAGLIKNKLYVRRDTPVHSALHEACHWLLMDEPRRQALHTDAGGTQLEENAVCFLQILLADSVPGMNRASMCVDMDRWGYNFRLGSAAAWFAHDAEDAFDFLQLRGWIGQDARYAEVDAIEPILHRHRTQHRPKPKKVYE